MTTRLATLTVQPAHRGFMVNATVYFPHTKTFEDFGRFHRVRKLAEDQAADWSALIIEVASAENERFDRARAYLATRAARVIPAPSQMELF